MYFINKQTDDTRKLALIHVILRKKYISGSVSFSGYKMSCIEIIHFVPYTVHTNLIQRCPHSDD